MLAIPFQINSTDYNVFVALEQDNIDRMKAYDPAQLEPLKLGMPWVGMRLNVVIIGFAMASDVEEAQRLAATGKGHEIPKLLSRGFQFKPEAGDHDGPYRRV